MNGRDCWDVPKFRGVVLTTPTVRSEESTGNYHTNLNPSAQTNKQKRQHKQILYFIKGSQRKGRCGGENTRRPILSSENNPQHNRDGNRKGLTTEEIEVQYQYTPSFVWTFEWWYTVRNTGFNGSSQWKKRGGRSQRNTNNLYIKSPNNRPSYRLSSR